MNPPHHPSRRQQPCDLCQNSTFELVSDRDRHGQELATVVCRTCGLVSHENVPSDTELQQYYAEQYRYEYHREHIPSPHRVLRAWRVGRSIVKLTRDYLRSRDRVLEVGAGIGCTVRAFQDEGFTASGIEPGRGFCEFARHRLGVDVRKCWLSELPAKSQFDFVLLVHVIEHFGSPRMALRTIWDALAPSGRLYVECPNVAAPHAAPGKLFHFAHTYNFTPLSLRMMCEANGFRLVRNFRHGDGRTIHMLFEKAHERCLEIPTDSYETSLRGIHRHSRFSYYTRLCYLSSRVRQACELISDHFFPSTRCRSILQQNRPKTNGQRRFSSKASSLPIGS